MPLPYQIVPQGSVYRPKIETHINDNSVVTDTFQLGGGETSAAMFVFASPKGRDNEVITIRNGQTEFMDEFGLGPFSVYGQPLLNAYAAARVAGTSNSLLHCLRVTPDDASYSTVTIIAKYKADTTADSQKLDVHFVAMPSTAEVTALEDLSTAVVVDDTPDENQFIAVKLFTLAYRGRGAYGKNMRFRLTSDRQADKENAFKNYSFSIYRNETILEQVDNRSVTMLPDALLNGQSLYIEDIINDVDAGSKYVVMYCEPTGVQTLFDEYVKLFPDTTYTLNDFDALLGIDKYTREAIKGYVISTPEQVTTVPAGETVVNLADASGIALTGGSDGSIAAGQQGRDAALNALYLKAFGGAIDPNIKSKNRFPSTFIYDANYDIKTKLAIASLAIQRGDCMAILDFGTGITTRESVKSYYDTNFKGVIDNRLVSLEPYAMKIRDPYSQKTVTVTSTYWMASAYPTHIFANGGKHRPMAGNVFGPIGGFITNSVYPLFDDELHSDLLDELADRHCNVAKYNERQIVVRSMQNTAQNLLSSLTEQNNVLVLLDVKRDCERMCARNEYDFSEPEDIARFNASVSLITDKYAAAQVRSISANFDKSPWEAERSILHLYVEIVCRDLVKTTIIEIDVNRADA